MKKTAVAGMIKNLDEFRYKQVIVFRSDLKLGKGKLAAQAGHAAVAASEEARKHNRSWWVEWMDEGQRKITVLAETEKDLLELEKKVEQLRLPHALIVDKGLTEIPPHTVTCLGIGPAPAEKIDKLTSQLPLL